MGAFPYRYRPVTFVIWSAPFHDRANPPQPGGWWPFFGLITDFPWSYRDRAGLGGHGGETPLIRGKAEERSHDAWERYHLYVSRCWSALLSFCRKRFRPTTASRPIVALRAADRTPGF